MIKQNIPNFLTCLNLTCGLLAIMSGDLDIGVYLVIAGGIFDVFDGMVARALNVSSPIGGELDSLADVVTFGVAPAILYYKAFAGAGQWWFLLGPICIVVAGAVRLARFNVTESKSNFFEGLAIPASGLTLCGLVYARFFLTGLSLNFLPFLFIAIGLALLNVSSIKMFSFKQFGSSKVKIYFAVIAGAGLLSLLLMPRLTIAVLMITYIFLAVINGFFIKETLS
ncbi:CDP-diacylglycerol--serine O-phosphatidyltransferase [Portibacter marinus]|uniref:CDP-diacylglycerol--serine O-phosphatidyltransferase n=1 Tax=Portibacter marinus TaxID=2898660 RepID=UPI001F40FDD3|nr:CDP-diacylglycerol--serine O-phosphatidyltransferase [Portibacter marinus]